MQHQPTPAWLEVEYPSEFMTPMQRQGLHCVQCARPWRRAVPVGYVQAPDGFQVFACEPACARILLGEPFIVEVMRRMGELGGDAA